MKWILIYLFWTGSEMHTTEVEVFERMDECFLERGKLAVDLGSSNGYFPINHQALCVRIE